MDTTTLIGVAGAGIVLLGFLLNQFGKITPESRTYDFLNVLGPLLLIVYSVLLDSYPFIVLNSVWLVVSAHGLYKSFRSS
jgi:hypothetical protein